jgi:hypothetical protein
MLNSLPILKYSVSLERAEHLSAWKLSIMLSILHEKQDGSQEDGESVYVV